MSLYVRLNSENVCVEMREKKKDGRYKSVHLLKTRLSIYVDVYILKKRGRKKIYLYIHQPSGVRQVS